MVGVQICILPVKIGLSGQRKTKYSRATKDRLQNVETIKTNLMAFVHTTNKVI